MTLSKSSHRSAGPILGVSIASLLALSINVHAAFSFLGVAAGDASSNDAIVWTRGVDSSNPASATVTVHYSTDSTFSTGVLTATGTTDSSAVGDYTAKIDLTGLQPATVYYYYFSESNSGATSIVGKFKTAPQANEPYALKFAFSGDCDGLIRPYALASQVPNKNLDFFMFDGDTIYETASTFSAAVHSSGNLPDPTVAQTGSAATATQAQIWADYTTKYRQQFLPVVNTNTSTQLTTQFSLQPFFAGQGNYTAYDNHELGNKQYINGGAPAGGPVGSSDNTTFSFTTGAGADARISTNDVTASGGPYINQSGGYLAMQNAFLNYQPMKNRGNIVSSDARMNGTKLLYFSQQWGRYAVFVNTDDRSYRDIRMKTAGNADDTGTRADNVNRTMLGHDQLVWLEQTLLSAEQAGTTWKFINVSDPIDEIGPIGGALTLTGAPTTATYGTLGNITSIQTTANSSGSTITVGTTVGLVVGQPVSGPNINAGATIASINTNGTTFTLSSAPTATVPSGSTLTLSGAASTYAPVSSDGGKSWMGGYRAERNALLKFIADNQIKNVVFLATDDHQNRINELTYSPTGATGNLATYVKVPYCFEIVCGPLGATGPDQITNHSFSQVVQPLAQSIANAQIAAGVEPIGLTGYPGLHNVSRLGDPSADTNRGPEDFYSPDTYNYNVLGLSPDGKTLTVTSYGINSTQQNTFQDYDSANNPEQAIFSFQIDATEPLNNIQHIVVVYQENWSFDGLYGSFPGANGIANASTASTSQIDRLGGGLLSSETGTNTFNRISQTNNTVNSTVTAANSNTNLGNLNNPPPPLGSPTGTAASNPSIVDTRFLSNPADPTSTTALNTLLPWALSTTIDPTKLTGDIVHRYWQEQFQINGADNLNTDHMSNSGFITWSDNPGLVMSSFDATNLPEGLLAQQYTLCDNFFHSAFGGSFLNHQFLIAAQAPVYYNTTSPAGPALSNVAYVDSTGLLFLNTSGSTAGRQVQDGNITPVPGDVFPSLTINGAAQTNVAANAQVFGAVGGVNFDKHYAVNTIRSANLPSGSDAFPGNGLLPTQNDSNPGDSTRPYILTIGDALSTANVSWKYYSGNWTQIAGYSKANNGSNPLYPAITDGGYTTANNTFAFQYHHQPFAYYDNYAPFGGGTVPVQYVGGFAGVLPSGVTAGSSGFSINQATNSAAHLQDESNFFTDVQNGQLPSVCFIKPVGINNEHPGYAALQTGQAHVASIIQALQANPSLWATTMVIVTYDEHGGRWDHVTPPVRDTWGPGVRVPCLVFSPMSKQGYVDHTQRDTSSILSTIEQRFGLSPLNSLDANAPTFANLITALQISRGGYVANARNHTVTQAVTITNNGSVPIIGPVQLVLDNLTSGISLQNATGTTTTNAPAGSPYITATTGTIAPGASVTVSLRFNLPVSGGVNYTARTVSGTSNP
jgi:phospholipase C/phosphodiesterase/alkaline phosphatase D-like protein